MSDREGDETKKSDTCKERGIARCPNMKETGGGFDGERYDCQVCGAHYYLDYEDMK